MIKGVSKQIDAADSSVWLCIIDSFSDELKNLIRTRLTSICHGCSSDNAYSYKNTLKTFMNRYKGKGQITKKGMIGELLAHLLVSHCDKNMKIASPFFNMEEPSIKKGFDLVLLNVKSQDLWFAEVKAGNAGKKLSNVKNKRLIGIAKNDIKKRLNSNKDDLWLNAINGVRIAFEKHTKFKKLVLEILNENYSASQNGKVSSLSKNVVLTSVVYKSPKDKLDFKEIQALREKILKEKSFCKIIIFSIQKETYTKIEKFLISEASNGQD
ncbi:MAG: SAVED domain-containing protein [Candidatus Omnitrophica bacterium]|nr:SAVED domain-containing protein [Candidatus Omnitrophota bacterium]